MNNNNYPQQKLRGMKRKYEAVQARGGKCERCGYSANLAALDFHHRNPLTKEFQIDMRVFSNTSLDKLKDELVNVNYSVLIVIGSITTLIMTCQM